MAVVKRLISRYNIDNGGNPFEKKMIPVERNFLPNIANYIPRPRVDALFGESMAYPLVLVIAGPGYGKSLSTAYFLKNADVRLLWLRISNHRDETAEFWEDFVRAAIREFPGYAKKLVELGFPGSSASFELFRQITASAAGDGKRIVFVVDNYERILNKNILRFFDNYIDSDMPGCTLFILCNAKLPFTGVLPDKGQFRITDADLAFTAEEVGAMFEHYGMAATPEELERAYHVTGGWPLGLRLVCAAGQRGTEGLVGKTSWQLAAELFEQHYFQRYPPAVQSQLIRFSLLPQFSLDMVSGRADIDGVGLHEMLLLHPFVSFDYGNGLFMFQPMYHEYLRQKQPLISPESRREVCAAAGRWFTGHGMMNEAMDCFWEAGDYDGLLQAISQLPKERKPIRLTDRILHRLEQIPRSYADKNLIVDFSIAFMYLNAARVEMARGLFLSLEKRLKAAPDTEENRLMLGDVYSTLADIGTFLNEDTGLEWIKKAAGYLPNGSLTHSADLMLVMNNSAFFLPGHEAGQLERMIEYVLEFATYADKIMNGNGSGFEFLFIGEACYFREEMDKSAIMFNSAILKAQQTGQHDIICNALWGLMRIEFYYANYKNALALLGEIEGYVNDNGLVRLYDLRDCAIAWFYIRLGDLGRVPAQFSQTMTGPEGEPVVLGRNRLTTAQYLALTGDAPRAFAVLYQLEQFLEHKGRWYEKFSMHLLKAHLHLAAGEAAEFNHSFGRAYEMVYANDIKLALSALGKDMMAMIDHIKKQDIAGYDLDWLDEVYRDALSYAKRLQTMRRAHMGEDHGPAASGLALTKREDETLRYLAQGLTQQEMAKLMGISSNAVKKHVAKIYVKLGAVNRADAIHIASISGLVDIINN